MTNFSCRLAYFATALLATNEFVDGNCVNPVFFRECSKTFFKRTLLTRPRPAHKRHLSSGYETVCYGRSLRP